MNANEPLSKYRNYIDDLQKRRTSHSLIRHTETYLLVCWSPVLRWHQFFLGLSVELGNHHLDEKLSFDEIAKFNKARVWDRVVCSSEGAPSINNKRKGVDKCHTQDESRPLEVSV